MSQILQNLNCKITAAEIDLVSVVWLIALCFGLFMFSALILNTRKKLITAGSSEIWPVAPLFCSPLASLECNRCCHGRRHLCGMKVSNSFVLAEVAQQQQGSKKKQILGMCYCWLVLHSFSICNALSLICINTVQWEA